MASAHVAEYNRILVHDIESKSSLVCHYLGDSGCVVRQYIFFFFFQFEGLGITCNIYIRRKLMENIRINICNITISSCSIDKIRDITKQKLIRDYIAVMPACLSLCSNIRQYFHDIVQICARKDSKDRWKLFRWSALSPIITRARMLMGETELPSWLNAWKRIVFLRIINHFVNKRCLFDYRLWPTYASAHNNLGTLSVGDQAEQHFLAAIHAQPGHVNAHYNLGQLYRSVTISHRERNVRCHVNCCLLYFFFFFYFLAIIQRNLLILIIYKLEIVT